MKFTKLIFINGEIETLNYFSTKLANCLEEKGYSIYFHDLFEDCHKLYKEIVQGETALITFNCTAVSGELNFMQDNFSIWMKNNIPIINILVDHPMYYHDQLTHIEQFASQYTHIICIDKFHLDYLRGFYPEAKSSSFMVLGGSSEESYIGKASDRRNEVIFTGNFTPCDRFLHFADIHGEEYRKFYMNIIDDLLADTTRPVEQVCIKHILTELPDTDIKDIREAVSKMLFIDLYIRFYLREKAIVALANTNIPLRLIGKGFDVIKLKSNKILKCTELMPTGICLSETSKSKISLNVMPWFKNGSHDRILSSMLCGTAVLSDSSIWLNENFVPGSDYIEYDNMNMDILPDLAITLLNDSDFLDFVAENGRKKALANHTWSTRANDIIKILENLLNS